MRDSNSGATLVIAGLVVALVIRRQLRTRPVRRTGSLLAPAILGVVGAAGLGFGVASVVKERPLGTLPIVLLAMSLVVAAGFGVLRARTVRIWRDPQGAVVRKGTPATTALWVASGVAHLGLGLWIDQVEGVGILGAASLYAYLAIGLGAQNLSVRGRATAL
ncbi:hypothetical protein ABR738_04270 [Streptomyces sp. Edi4]|uniref:hypothetical protein n=1 Tax=Streptomyces sp. Edi4 TaxID=3162527 RepID=UPI0033059922